MKKNDNIYSSVWRDLFRIVDSIRVRSSDNRDKQFFSLTFNQLRMIHRVYTYQTENDGRGIDETFWKYSISPLYLKFCASIIHPIIYFKFI